MIQIKNLVLKQASQPHRNGKNALKNAEQSQQYKESYLQNDRCLALISKAKQISDLFCVPRGQIITFIDTLLLYFNKLYLIKRGARPSKEQGEAQEIE